MTIECLIDKDFRISQSSIQKIVNNMNKVAAQKNKDMVISYDADSSLLRISLPNETSLDLIFEIGLSIGVMSKS